MISYFDIVYWRYCIGSESLCSTGISINDINTKRVPKITRKIKKLSFLYNFSGDWAKEFFSKPKPMYQAKSKEKNGKDRIYSILYFIKKIDRKKEDDIA